MKPHYQGFFFIIMLCLTGTSIPSTLKCQTPSDAGTDYSLKVDSLIQQEWELKNQLLSHDVKDAENAYDIMVRQLKRMAQSAGTDSEIPDIIRMTGRYIEVLRTVQSMLESEVYTMIKDLGEAPDQYAKDTVALHRKIRDVFRTVHQRLGDLYETASILDLYHSGLSEAGIDNFCMTFRQYLSADAGELHDILELTTPEFTNLLETLLPDIRPLEAGFMEGEQLGIVLCESCNIAKNELLFRKLSMLISACHLSATAPVKGFLPREMWTEDKGDFIRWKIKDESGIDMVELKWTAGDMGERLSINLYLRE